MMPLSHQMKPGPRACLTLAAALLLLSACHRKTDTAAPPAADTPATAPATTAPPESTAASPTAPIAPESATAPDAQPATGPAEGGTAIGGVVANQDGSGNSSGGSAPAPTGGDAATTKPATTPSR